ncbi:MAG: YbjN domain-containing protein [Bacteroidetes bacterium]|nr:YbjN domain-containing protein [Bacteroidota bacterium]
MGIFDRIFGNGNNNEPQPDIKFGRYSDSYKESANYDAWDIALEKFENEEYLESFRQFFIYLRDEREDNVQFREVDNGIQFEIFQGSKKISGFADNTRLKAEAKVARTSSLNVGFMRRLLEKNFSLKYSRFALDGNDNITILFDTYTLDGSPYKLYYALKEVATNADKQDDLLLDEFKMLDAVESTHLIPLPEQEKEVKYQYISHSIQTVLDEIENGKLNTVQYPGGIAYLLLDLTYRLDYLTKPEGVTMENLERIHRQYFANESKNTAQRNLILQKEYKKLLNRPKEEFFKELYHVKATFGITNPVNHDRIVSFIDGELHNMDWYQDNKHYMVALAIPGYIVGYCLFNYAIPKPDRKLMHLYYQIVEAAYFKNLGFTINYYDAEEKNFNKKAIRKAIEAIVGNNLVKYPNLNPTLGTLNYSSLPGFAKSYLLMIRNLDMTKAE